MLKNNEYKILLVDDEPDIIEFLGYNLRKEGYDVYTAENGKNAIKIAKKITPHLILLDVMMPEIDGIETCEELRKIDKLENTLISFLTARGEDYSQIAGFEAGADDYLTKPIKPKVLVNRVNALLKRHYSSSRNSTKTKEDVVKVGNIKIDKEKYVIFIDDKKLSLPRKEFELLLLLISKPEKVFTRDEIYHKVWGDDIVVGDRTIDVHIRKLREKIGDECIKTIKGVGYTFVQID